MHSVLTDATWQGADLRTLIEDQLLSGVMEKRQLNASGPDVNLPPQLALHVALMLHELGTNAAKYGALSVSAGTVAVRWAICDVTRRGVPFVFVTGYGRETLPQAFTSAPILAKPTSPEKLVKAVAAMLRNASSLPQSRAAARRDAR